MGLTANVVSNAPILATWGNEIRDRSVQVFASAAERSAQWTSPPEGACSYLVDLNQLHVYNGTAWVCTTPVSTRSPAAPETRTSTAYGDPATPGPAVSIATGALALVTIAASIDNAGLTNIVYASVAITGATTRAAADADAFAITGPAGVGVQGSYTALISGLTPGVNIFTMKFRAGGGTISISNRVLTVVGIP